MAASSNPFELLRSDEDAADPMTVLSKISLSKDKDKDKSATAASVIAKKKDVAASAPPAKLPFKPPPPAQAVRESRYPNEGGRGRGMGRGGGRGPRSFGSRDQQYGRGGGRGRGGSFNGDGDSGGWRGGGDYYDSSGAGTGEYLPTRSEDGEGTTGDRSRGRGRRGRDYGGRGSTFGSDSTFDDTHKRIYERHSATGRRGEIKRDGAGRGNWGTAVDQGAFQESEDVTAEEEKPITDDKQEAEVNQETTEEKKEEEDKEMTLDEYEKIQEEKRKALLALKAEERKVDAKEFESMQLLSKKKDDDTVFMKVGLDKDKGKKIDAGEKDEKIKKSMNITEFLKPADGAGYYRGGRGRGRGRGERGGFRGGYAGGSVSNQPEAPSIEDHGQFPTLGGK